jgi:redox-sensitive bicupin YhaK (pirin superfamily)
VRLPLCSPLMSTLPANDPACADPTGDHIIDLVIAGRPRGVGTLTVARLLPAPRRRMVGPFVFLDHMGPVTLDPGVGFDVRPHPHIGLSTVTYLFAGENVHRDSLGNVQVNRPGDLNLMTAGRGIVHSERADPGFRAAGGAMHGVQIWLALPDAHEDDAPSFEHHPQATLPAIAPSPGVRGRVLFGEAYGARSPIRHPSAPLLVDLELAAGATVELPDNAAERAVFVIDGELGLAAERLEANQLAVLCAGRPATLSATTVARVLLLGGAPLGPRLIEWNFVASSRERLDRARDAWKARQFPAIPGDDREFIPWPDDHH